MAENDKTGKTGFIQRWVGRFMAVPRNLIAALILFSIALNFANVIGRYVFLSPIIWAEEIMIYIMVWCVFIGAILVSWDGRHLRMDLLSQTLSSPWKEALNLFVLVAFLVSTGFVAVQSWDVVSLFASFGQKSTVAGIPMVIPHVSLLIGFGLMFVCVAVRFRAYVQGTLLGEAEEMAEQEESGGDEGRGGAP